MANKKDANKPVNDTPKETVENGEPAQANESYVLTHEEAATIRAHVDSLQAQVNALTEERDNEQAAKLRVQADFANYRKRNASIATESIEDGRAEIATALLPVFDNFDRALESFTGLAKEYYDGVIMVYKNLFAELARYGLAEIPCDGQFDPNLHEAVDQTEAEGHESGDIVSVFRKGYKLNDKILRHSMVIVAK